jgi:hypothetical protein
MVLYRSVANLNALTPELSLMVGELDRKDASPQQLRAMRELCARSMARQLNFDLLWAGESHRAAKLECLKQTLPSALVAAVEKASFHPENGYPYQDYKYLMPPPPPPLPLPPASVRSRAGKRRSIIGVQERLLCSPSTPPQLPAAGR